MIFLNRNRSGSDPHLEWKVRFFFLGAALALAGVALESSLLVTVAIVVLVGGAALRFLPGSKDDAGEGADADTRGGAETRSKLEEND